MTDLPPPAARVALAAIAFALAWATFGRGENRRPWVVAAAGLGCGWLALAGEGAAFLIAHHAKWWLPTIAVGVAGSWFLVRKTRGTPAGRHWATGCVALCVAAPLLSRAGAVVEQYADLAGRLIPFTSPWHAQEVTVTALRSTAILLAAGCVAAACWGRRDEDPEPPR